MAVAERFGKTDIDVRFQPTQMIAMLALPAGDEEKFIAEKAAEGTTVENMTIKNLREEIRQYKLAKEKSSLSFFVVQKIRFNTCPNLDRFFIAPY